MNTLVLDKKEYVVVPKETWQGMVDLAEDKADSDFARRLLDQPAEEALPAAMVERLVLGEEPPLRVWREYRGFGVRELAETIGISSAYLSDIERGKKDGSIRVLKKLAQALQVSVDDLI